MSLISYGFCQGQGTFYLQKTDHDKIPFKLINNLIVIPVQVNGVDLSFLLDTGVSKPIIFNFLNLNEALQINQAERIFLRGLGEGESIEALRSRNNIFRVGQAININQDLYAVFDPAMNFAPRLGVPIHGIFGYSLLKDFVVEVNYAKKHLRLYKPEAYKASKCRGCRTLDLDFFNNKPYVDSQVKAMGDEQMDVKLLIDTGGSDALWLFEDAQKGLNLPEKFFVDFLGRGLSGSVYGKRSKLETYSIAGYELKKVNVAYPDSTSISYARKFKDRSGSVSGEILKRFNIVFDYRNARMHIKKNKYFSDPFYYNRSGITLEHSGVRVVREIDRDRSISRYGSDNESTASFSMTVQGEYKYSLAPSFRIVELRIDSPAHRAGLEVGDVVLNINNRHAHQYSLQQITEMFQDEEGKRIRLLVDRKGVQKVFYFKLESLMK